jgi:hypothetical protein
MSDTRPQTTLDPNYARYYRTVLEFHIEGKVISVPVDQTVDAGVAYDLNFYCPGPGFVVLTAFNPRGRPTPEDVNHRRQAEFEKRLEAERKHFVRCDGVDPESSHREPGVALHLDRRDAHELAVELLQSAMYWFDGSRLWLVPVLARGRRSEVLPKGQKTHSGDTTIKI